MVDKDSMHAVLRDTCGRAKYKYPTGEMFIMNIDMAGMGTKRIRIANLPPEVHETIHEALTPFGKVLNIHEEKWARTYRYPIPNGVQVSLHLTRHLPSHMIIDGNRVLISHKGQSATCYGCGAIRHLHQVCPLRRVKETETQEPAKSTCASMVTNTVITNSEEIEDITQPAEKKAKTPQQPLQKHQKHRTPFYSVRQKSFQKPTRNPIRRNKWTPPPFQPTRLKMDHPAVHIWMKWKNGRERRRQKCPSKAARRDDRPTNRYKRWPPGPIIPCPPRLIPHARKAMSFRKKLKTTRAFHPSREKTRRKKYAIFRKGQRY